MSQRTTLLFREEQRFARWIIVMTQFILMGCAGTFGWGLYQQLVLKQPFGDRPMGDGALIATSIVVFTVAGGVALLIGISKLITEVRGEGLFVRFVPFHLCWRQVPLERIVRFEAVTYRPIRQYGGWGIRWVWRGKAYNARGNRGVRLDFDNGRHLLIGSQRAEELTRAITAIVDYSSNQPLGAA